MRSTNPARLLASTALVLALTACGSTVPAPDTGATPTPPVAEPTPPGALDAFLKGKERMPGLFDVVVDDKAAKVWLLLPPADEDGLVDTVLMVDALSHGMGSNPVGLDRGKLGSTRLVELRRVGNRLFVEQPNLAFRAESDNPDEVRAVREAFARSILWSGKVAAESKDGHFVVELTDLVVRDVFGVARTLENTGQGSFSMDAKRSTLDPASVLAFPDNLVFESFLTFAGKKPGSEVQRVTPDPHSITLKQRIMLVRLPDDGYEPRRFDPRSGALYVQYKDYAVPLTDPMDQRWIIRHRLAKKDPSAPMSEPVEPIVYYLDRGAPEPVRSALLEGGRWWNQAFEAAGYIDAFRVEILPEGAHPLDVRYNVIQWVHRQTRGWSYGFGVVDPRTGERIKGHVSLGSLRVRQDRRLFEGLLGNAKTGTGAADDPIELSLARIRQLSAHEIGHTIGFTHNFAASTYGGRASVMDYPAPLVRMTEDGEIDVSAAYGVGIGDWDKTTVQYAYSDFPEGVDEADELQKILERSLARGEEFIADTDARPVGGAHPTAHLWDNGGDAAAALDEAMSVRRTALDRFGIGNLAPGEPLGLLQQTFVPVYFHHRFQLEAAVKLVGGVDYRYALAGDGQPGARVVPDAAQDAALDALLATLDPAELDVNDATLELLVPPPFGYQGYNRELARGAADPIFDPLAVASSAADATVRLLLARERCVRLVDQERRMQAELGLGDVVDRLIERTFDRRAETERLRAIQREVQRVVVDRMIERAFDESTPNAVRVVLESRLGGLQNRLVRRGSGDGIDAMHDGMLARDLDRFLFQREWEEPEGWRAAPLPPGSPIGSACEH